MLRYLSNRRDEMMKRKMASDVHQAGEKMHKEKKKSKGQWFATSSSGDVMDSSTKAPADSSNPSNSSILHRAWDRIRLFSLSGKSSSSEQKSSNTKTDACSSTATQKTNPITSLWKKLFYHGAEVAVPPAFTVIDVECLQEILESVVVEASTEQEREAKGGDDGQTALGSSNKCSFPFPHHILGEIRPFCLPGKSSSSVQENSDTKTDACSSTAVDRSSEEHPEVDLPAATQETKPFRSTLSKQQAVTRRERALCLPNLGNTCYMSAVLQCLLSASPFQEGVLSQREDCKNKAVLLRALSDLHLVRLRNTGSKLKKKHLAEVKAIVEQHFPVFKGNQHQDAHEFLMACLSCLSEESETLKTSWPTLTCPVPNMEFKLKCEITCDSCGFQRSFGEDFNHLPLVIGPQACLTDSLQQCLSVSSIDCDHCSGTKANKTLQFLSFPQVLVLLVMRFDITSSSMSKLKGQLEIPERFTLSSAEGGSTSRHQHTIPTHWCCVASGKQFVLWTLHQSYP